MLYGFLGGAVLGTAFYDLLNALGLHWLAWPVVGLLLLAAVVLTLVKSGKLRKRS